MISDLSTSFTQNMKGNARKQSHKEDDFSDYCQNMNHNEPKSKRQKSGRGDQVKNQGTWSLPKSSSKKMDENHSLTPQPAEWKVQTKN